MHYYVVGVNGGGKTSLLQAISDYTGITVVHGTSVLMEHLDIPGDYQALRAMDQAAVLEAWGRTAEQLVAGYNDRPFLLDTHIMNLTGGKLLRRDGDWIKHYDVLLLVKAAPATILQRVTADTGKDRALFPADLSDDEKLSMLDDYQQQTEALFDELAERYQLRTQVIDNDARLDDGVRNFMRLQQ